MYSVISVTKERLPGTTKNWHSTRSWTTTFFELQVLYSGGKEKRNRANLSKSVVFTHGNVDLVCSICDKQVSKREGPLYSSIFPLGG